MRPSHGLCALVDKAEEPGAIFPCPYIWYLCCLGMGLRAVGPLIRPSASDPPLFDLYAIRRPTSSITLQSYGLKLPRD
eukprot:6199014-Pleurochrysis_carterae.AAC.3